MTKMYKKLLAMIMAILMVVSMAACGAPAAEAPAATEAPKADDTTKENKEDTLVIWTNLTAEAQAKVLDKQFAEVSKEMGINYEIVTISFNDMLTKMVTAKESGETPDIIHTGEGGIAYMYANNLSCEVSDVIDTIGRDDFVPSSLAPIVVGDEIWGVPDWTMHTSVWYRKDLFEEKGLKVPTTWEEFTQCAKELSIDQNGDGNIDVYGFPVPLHPTMVGGQTLFEFLYSAGVYVYDPDTGEYVFGDNKEKITEIVEYLVELYKEVSPPSAVEWSWGEYRNALVEGTVAMTLDMGAVIGLAQSNNPDMVEKIGCFDLPGPDGVKEASFGGAYYFIAGDSGNAEKNALIKDFIVRLYTSERAAERALSRPMFAFPSIYSAFEIYKKDESVALFQNEVATITDSLSNTKWYRHGMEAGLDQLVSQIEGTTFIGEALQAAAMDMVTAAEAVEMIDMGLQEQISIIGG